MISIIFYIFAVLQAVFPLYTTYNQTNNLSKREGPSAFISQYIPFKIRENNVKPNNIWGSHKAPYPTNKWWLNLVMGNGQEKIYPYPYTVSASDEGIFFYHGSIKVEDSKTFVNKEAYKWSVGCKDGFSGRKIYEYDDLMVKMKFNSSKNNQKYMVSFLLKGSPYMSFYYKDLKPDFTFQGSGIDSLESKGIENKSYIAHIKNGRKYAIFFSEPLKLTVERNELDSFTLLSAEEYTGMVRIALIPDDEDYESNYDILFKHSRSIPISAKVEFKANSIIHTYKVTERSEKGSLLLLTHPHHRDSLTNPRYIQELGSYKSLRGDMIAIIGNVWNLKYEKLSGSSVRNIHKKKIKGENLNLIKNSLKQEILYIDDYPQSSNIYFNGKKLARLARIALIAEQVGLYDIVDKSIIELTSRLEKIFTYNISNPIYYDQTWGGICTGDGLNSEGNDFGNGVYNDHNFHYGYYIYSLYSIIELKGIEYEWVKKNIDKIHFLANEYSNSGGNKYFTKFRHMDFYDGNSWVNGFHVFENSRNMESTSESVNAYYSTYLLYSVLNNDRDSNISNLLLTSEIKSAQKYWQIKDESIYKSPFSKNKIVGVLWENSAEYTTWFGNNPEYIYGIQFLPFTPISFELIDKAWMEKAWSTIKSRVFSQNYVAPEWKGLIYMAGALVDTSINVKTINSLTAYDNGNSKTNALWWIYNCSSD
ncbi:Endo-1,3(4)-beta-glucanase 2 [Smittium culicis]|uniref:glucan endo-1,3-beta-D-glucosidase n=1 Tax=Smittium culicis TaxID=133412 RepID=A0A1R1Y175_9FUNG|nr:Endo-1,3(4)-beta-glucanase 2 [Smittium culicis]